MSWFLAIPVWSLMNGTWVVKCQMGSLGRLHGDTHTFLLVPHLQFFFFAHLHYTGVRRWADSAQLYCLTWCDTPIARTLVSPTRLRGPWHVSLFRKGSFWFDLERHSVTVAFWGWVHRLTLLQHSSMRFHMGPLGGGGAGGWWAGGAGALWRTGDARVLLELNPEPRPDVHSSQAPSSITHMGRRTHGLFSSHD